MDKDPKRVKSILSNVVNRLIIMMSEDIGIAEPSIVQKIHYCYTNYLSTNDLSLVLIMYHELIHAKKTRYLSDIKSVFLLPFFDDIDLSVSDIVSHNQMMKKFLPNYEIPQTGNVSMKEWKHFLIQKDFKNVFILVGMLLRPQSIRKENIKKMWEILLSISEKKEIQILHFFYKKMTHKEKTLYLYHALLYFILDIKSSKMESSSLPKMSFDKDEKINIELDEFVYDKHTKSNKKNNYDFALEGSWIFQEEIIDPMYRIVYRRKKQLQDHQSKVFLDQMNLQIIEKMDRLFDNSFIISITDKKMYFKINKISKKYWEDILQLPHGQKRCGKHKKVVYVSEDFIYKEFILLMNSPLKQLYFINFYWKKFRVIKK
jgi:hypothetical protein